MADREEVPRTAIPEETAPQGKVWEIDLLVAESMRSSKNDDEARGKQDSRLSDRTTESIYRGFEWLSS